MYQTELTDLGFYGEIVVLPLVFLQTLLQLRLRLLHPGDLGLKLLLELEGLVSRHIPTVGKVANIIKTKMGKTPVA